MTTTTTTTLPNATANATDLDLDPDADLVETYTATVLPTELRMNDLYVFWYNNLAKLIITGT